MIISTTGKNGGIGKSLCSLNISLALSQLGKKVLLIDADMGSARLHGYLNKYNAKNLSHILQGEDIKNIIEPIHGIDFIDNLPCSTTMANLEIGKLDKITNAIMQIYDDYDYIICDMSAGVSRAVTSFLFISNRVIVIAQGDNREGVLAAYHVGKLVVLNNKQVGINIIVNMADTCLAHKQFDRLYNNFKKFLDKEVKYLGNIDKCNDINKYINMRTPAIISNPHCRFSNQIINIAKELIHE